MKKLMIYVIMVLFTVSPALAQNNFFEELTNQYSDKDGFSASMITKDMFDLYLKKKNIDDKSTVYEALNSLDKITIVSQSNFGGYAVATSGTSVQKAQSTQNESVSRELYETILNHYKDGNFTLLKTEKRMGEEVKVYLKKNQDKIAALAVLTNSSYNTNLIELEGDINLTAVADLNKALNLKGLENLYKIDNTSNMYYGQAMVSGYSQERVEEMVARQRELAEKHMELNKEQLAKIEKQAQMQAQKQMEMMEKYQQMAETYGRQPIFLNYPGDTNTVYYLDGKKVKANDIKELDKDDIKTIEVTKAKDENEKTTIKIKTK